MIICCEFSAVHLVNKYNVSMNKNYLVNRLHNFIKI
jgi:hypothetical protein